MVSSSDVKRTVSFFSPPSPAATNPNARPHGAHETKGRLTRIKGLDPDKSTKKYWAVNSLHTVNKSYFISVKLIALRMQGGVSDCRSNKSALVDWLTYKKFVLGPFTPR